MSLGIGLLVGFLAKGKKHWFTIEFEGVADHPENYHYLRLDKGNYRRILQAVEAATGLEAKLTEGVSTDDYSTWRAVRFADRDEIG